MATMKRTTHLRILLIADNSWRHVSYHNESIIPINQPCVALRRFYRIPLGFTNISLFYSLSTYKQPWRLAREHCLQLGKDAEPVMIETTKRQFIITHLIQSDPGKKKSIPIYNRLLCTIIDDQVFSKLCIDRLTKKELFLGKKQFMWSNHQICIKNTKWRELTPHTIVKMLVEWQTCGFPSRPKTRTPGDSTWFPNNRIGTMVDMYHCSLSTVFHPKNANRYNHNWLQTRSVVYHKQHFIATWVGIVR